MVFKVTEMSVRPPDLERITGGRCSETLALERALRIVMGSRPCGLEERLQNTLSVAVDWQFCVW